MASRSGVLTVGAMLSDYRSAQSVGAWEPAYWGVGCSVFVRDGMQTLSYDTPNCATREPTEGRA